MEQHGDSLFEKQFSTFLELFKKDNLFEGIPDEYQEQVINLMVTAAFHVSMAGRVYALHALRNGGEKGPLMQEFIADTMSSFEGIGMELGDVLEHAKDAQDTYRPSVVSH